MRALPAAPRPDGRYPRRRAVRKHAAGGPAIQIDEASVAVLAELAARHLGADDAAVFLAGVASSVLLRVSGEADPAGTGSRLGGVPLLPAGLGWPTIGPDTWGEPRLDEGDPLRFLGQVNTSEVNPLRAGPALPADTVLGFFFEAAPGHAPLHWTDLWEAAAHRVVAAPVDDAQPVGDMRPAYALRPEVVTTVPPIEYFTLGLSRRRGAFEALYAELRPVPLEYPNRMFGWFDEWPRGLRWDSPDTLLLQVTLDPALRLGWERTRRLYAFSQGFGGYA